ncbi:MAG: hypothetical protein V5A56_08985 [Halolamina sp.]|uniref:hypothetical protein n=1 Tax=Halolamina sp. TaxID=1940283 RepID=UPI002FC2FD50
MQDAERPDGMCTALSVLSEVDVHTDILIDISEDGAHELLNGAARFAEKAGIEPTSKPVEYGPSIHEAIFPSIEETIATSSSPRASTGTSSDTGGGFQRDARQIRDE